jgi:hypothetical protein
MSLALIKLNNNQEIVADLISGGLGTTMRITAPRFIAYNQTPDGAFQASLMAYSPIHPEGTYDLNTTDVLSIAVDELPEILISMYKGNTTGLDLNSGRQQGLAL